MSSLPLYIAWDNSNIWLCGRNLSSQKEPGHEEGFRIHFRNLIAQLKTNRTIDRIFVAGSIPPENDSLWEYLKQANANLQLKTQERGAGSGGEVAVDDIIQKDMLEYAIDWWNEGKSYTFLLLTGDGAGSEKGEGFIPTLCKVKSLGHSIEVASWSLGLNRKLKQYAEENGNLTLLDNLYDKITFIQNERPVLWATDK